MMASTETKEAVAIEGVPPSISAKLVQAIKAGKTLFKHRNHEHVSPKMLNLGDISQASSAPDNVVASILQRMEESKSQKDQRKEKEQQDKFRYALQSWLDSLKQENKNAALPCLRYVWKLQEHQRPLVRRMALYLCGYLLLCSEECRQVWKEDLLLDWLSSVASINQKKRKLGESQGDKELVLWQQEALAWVAELVQAFPDCNKFRVAQLYLEQTGISFDTDGSDFSKTMADWRQIRDLALQHGMQQCNAIDKLVQRAYTCMDILIPRISENHGKEGNESVETANCDDDEYIAWEEGDEVAAAESHAAAVEETLALMQVTGHLQGGDLVINLNGNSTYVNPGGDDRARIDGINDKARRRLERTVTSLSSRHLPCLTTWVNAMSQSDNLTLTESGALVAMSREDKDTRHAVMQRLMQTKSTVASVLVSAARMEISSGKPASGSLGSLQPLTNVPRRHLGLSNTIEQRQRGPSTDVTRKRSNLIQIKFNKTKYI